MSFSLTTDQVRARTKTVTRRTGWENLKPGEEINACVKCMGLQKGEKVEQICRIKVVSVRREPLSAIRYQGIDETAREGFPEMTPAEFVTFFLAHNRGTQEQMITRIEFEYLS